MHPHTCFQCDHEYIFLFRHDLIVSFLLRKGYLSGTYLNMCVFNFSANLTGWIILNFIPTSKWIIKNSIGKVNYSKIKDDIEKYFWREIDALFLISYSYQKI